ncbi:MAG: DnrO protein [Rhodanobacter sp.]
MKFVNSLISLICGVGLALAAQAAPQHAHEHRAMSVAPSAAFAVPVPARRWIPDASLKIGIRRAHVAVDQLKHHEMGHMSEPMVRDRAREVEDAVTFMFAHCKLAAKPDAALHGILVPLFAAAKSLEADPHNNVGAVAEMRAALARYPQYFSDPGWSQPAPLEQVMHDEP